ncbi:spore germination protein YaaH [Tumebacillus sp. BK434]|uniref:glycosyl hydrolase family 18 protein n=1 Tax=Tumebacillus sp. BK434 TaxID=2512169 RepID=UPI0010439B14|nr:glycosyl hydrolase family 18 protein [Tumebacillus sp. BK434]TCP59223.1 spore germination protein YaaH [Tumebacillus sp. BK434]
MEGSKITYAIVKAGETWGDLATRYEVSIEELLQLNRGVREVTEGDLVKVIQEAPHFKHRRRAHYVLGFYTGPMGVTMPGSQGTLERQAGKLSAIAPYYFDIDRSRSGQIKARVSPQLIKETIRDAHQRGVKVLASIHNTDKHPNISGNDALHSVLRAHRMPFYNHLFALLKEYGFDGINLDFEHLRPGDKHLYTDFVRDLSNRARAQNYTLTVDVLGDVAKTPYSLDFDYPGVAESVDHLGIMTYDQFRPTQAVPGPVAGLPWVAGTIQAALNEGVAPEKILLGIGSYGYDWTVGQPNPRALSHSAAESLRRRENAVVQFHPSHKVPFFTYTDKKGQPHEVWYEDARSIALKLDLVRRHNLAGILFWRLGLEDPAAWGVIQAKLGPII